MGVFYRRTVPGPRENWSAALVATGLALGVASVSFYLVRTFLSRERLEPLHPTSGGEKARGVENRTPSGAEGEGG